MDCTTYEILHFDDETDNVSWLPYALFDYLCDLYPIEDDDSACKIISNQELLIRVTSTTKSFQLRYRLFQTQQAIEEAIAEISAHTDCAIILDLMHPGGDTLQNVGDIIFNKLSNDMKNRVHFLTNYARKIPKSIINEIGIDRIWNKPPISDTFCSTLLNFIKISK